ncbi:hypothetical protein HX827_01290 [Marine Group I thaumarchaeote]|uniref:Class I SAM-dependent methyltransferase n=1 Tax=Marine Group I thaumarchaeote TaxID=2511932 RepID=A0A7K4NSE0_9ARCH|nr:hypothetical protein [Marine Group I thaumarchaeote]
MKNESHKTAIPRKEWSKPGRWLYEHFFQKDNITLGSMLDFGAGKSIDSECWQKETGAIAQAYDEHEQPKFPGRGNRPDGQKFGLVTVIFVLNVVETDQDRIKILNDAMQYVKPDGYIFIATRSKKDIANAVKRGNNWKEISPGAYVSDPRKNTIQCGVDDQDIQSLISKSDYSHFTYKELNEHPGSEIGCALFQNTRT